MLNHQVQVSAHAASPFPEATLAAGRHDVHGQQEHQGHLVEHLQHKAADHLHFVQRVSLELGLVRQPQAAVVQEGLDVELGMNPIATLEKQVLSTIENLV